MSGWPSYTVAELQSEGVLLVEDGNHGEYRPRPNEFVEDGVPFIRATDIANGQVLFDRAGRINEVALRRVRKGIGKPGDILFSHKGTVGKLARVPLNAPPFVCSPQTTFWRVLDQARLRRDYLYAFMRSRLFIDQWWVRKGETDMADYVSLTAQRQLRVTIPPIDVQRRIAEPLWNLDELIENNSRRMVLLEQMTEAIYREWFVHFRYPGHEDATLVDSALGPIPEGWEASVLDQLVENVKVTVDPTKLDPETPAVGLEHIPRHQLTLDDWGTAEVLGSRKTIFGSWDVLFGRIRPYFHKVSIAPFDGICSTDAIVVRPAAPYWGLAVLTMFSDEFVGNATQTSNGTKMPRADWKVIKEFPVVLPPVELSSRFTEVARYALGTSQDLMLQSRKLAAMRDLLLPRLVTGQNDVLSPNVGDVVESVA